MLPVLYLSAKYPIFMDDTAVLYQSNDTSNKSWGYSAVLFLMVWTLRKTGGFVK